MPPTITSLVSPRDIDTLAAALIKLKCLNVVEWSPSIFFFELPRDRQNAPVRRPILIVGPFGSGRDAACRAVCVYIC